MGLFETKGIYHIGNWKVDFPIQVIVSRELEGKEYAGFRAITKNPRLEDIQQIMEDIKKHGPDPSRLVS